MKIKMALEEALAEAELFSLMDVNGRLHVLYPFERNKQKCAGGPSYEQPNYLNTGCALIGVLRPGQGFSHFKAMWIERKVSPPEVPTDPRSYKLDKERY